MDEYFSTGVNYRNQINRSFAVIHFRPHHERHEEQQFSNDKPVVKKIFVAQELIQNDYPLPRTIRQYSCQEVHNSAPSPIEHTSFVEAGYVKQINLKPASQFCTQEEPMEVDTSLDYSSNMCSDVSESKQTKLSLKCGSTQDTTHHRKPKLKSKGQTSSLQKLDNLFVKKRKEVPVLVRLILTVIVIIAALLFVVYMVFDYNAYVDLNALENEFAIRLYEQKDAVHAVVHSLRYVQWHKPVKILNFVGRSGVGKTLIANIVKLHFNNLFVNDLHSTELHNVIIHQSIIKNLYSRYMNLIVIDDLNVNDLDSLIDFIEKLEKHEALVLVIAIFSIQKVDDKLNSVVYYKDISTIHKKFDKTGFCHEVIAFDEITIVDAREYLGKKLDLYNVDVELHNKVASRVLQDHNFYRNGLKELHSKILIEIDRLNLT